MEYLFIQETNYDNNQLKLLLNSLKKELTKTKCKIDHCPHRWDKIKKTIHLYEYVYTTSYYRKNISNVIPFSRSFFKMTEIIQEYKLLEEDKKYNITCLAEAPGGFIQSFLSHSSVQKIDAITLISKDVKVPYWHKMLLTNDSINFHTGINKDGDLYSLKNVLSFINNIGKSSVDIVTGDGGFDYSGDYNNQEKDSLKLIYSEIFIAINIQKKGGCFICKIFDIFCEKTYQLLYLLKQSYNNILIYKPCISRSSNSEKYIICLDFRGYNKMIVNKMIHHFEDNSIDYEIENNFLNCIYKINKDYTKIQIDQINYGIDLINHNNNIKIPSNKQITMAKDWCKMYDIEINKDCIYLN